MHRCFSKAVGAFQLLHDLFVEFELGNSLCPAHRKSCASQERTVFSANPCLVRPTMPGLTLTKYSAADPGFG